ncbi:protein PYRICULARIA ORYZAE RESISTANCE 21-like [Cornus florida]|uniref:protein PYRICULARIA ORYZAE RESISTANCE 21-like n=1 Tax=Cornus florida TaxID=4283 RepID=UPI00289C6CB0|nr:protein PYRICULARIA ORYZAE RESISTANCE 21-like [Cornus florida]
MAEKVVIMVLKVDLQCPKCFKKVKKVLGKFPREIRDQKYDEKQNTVTIEVMYCCSPERFRDKLCWKGGRTIKSIEIKEPPKPKPAAPKADPPKPVDNKKVVTFKEPPKPVEPVPKLVGPVHVPVPVTAYPWYDDPCGWPPPPPPPGFDYYGNAYYNDGSGPGYGRPCQVVVMEDPPACTIM